MKISFLLLISFLLMSCHPDQQPIVPGPITAKKQRYSVINVDPPIVYHNAQAFYGWNDNLPGLRIEDKNGRLVEDLNNYYSVWEDEDEKYYETYFKMRGLGWSFNFLNADKKRKYGIEKSSITWEIAGDKIIEDYYYREDKTPKDAATLTSGITQCKYEVKNGLSCRNIDPAGTTDWINIWHDKLDPVIEMTGVSYYSMVAITQSGKLIAIQASGGELNHWFIHKDLQFVKNSLGRFIICSEQSFICLQTNEKDVNCTQNSHINYKKSLIIEA